MTNIHTIALNWEEEAKTLAVTAKKKFVTVFSITIQVQNIVHVVFCTNYLTI